MSHRTRALLRASLVIPAILLAAACGSAPTGPSAPPALKADQARLNETDNPYDDGTCGDTVIPPGYRCRGGAIDPHG